MQQYIFDFRFNSCLLSGLPLGFSLYTISVYTLVNSFVTSCELLLHLVNSCFMLATLVTSCELLLHLVNSCYILSTLVTSCVLFEERIGCFKDPPPAEAKEFIINLVGFFRTLQVRLTRMPCPLFNNTIYVSFRTMMQVRLTPESCHLYNTIICFWIYKPVQRRK